MHVAASAQCGRRRMSTSPCRPGRPAALIGDAGAAPAYAARAAAASWACYYNTLRVCPGSASASHARMFCAGNVVAVSMRPACRCCLLCFCYAGCLCRACLKASQRAVQYVSLTYWCVVPELCTASSDAHAVMVSVPSRGLRNAADVAEQSRTTHLFALSASHHACTTSTIHMSRPRHGGQDNEVDRLVC